MATKLFFIFLLNLLLFTYAGAQSTKIQLGTKKVVIKGTIFNKITYNFTSGKVSYVAYRFVDKIKQSLLISEVTYEFENGKAQAVMIETYTCPLARIGKQASYSLAMEDEFVPGKKYWRLTLLTNATGADDLHFTKTRYFADAEPETTNVNNVTINIENKIDAQKWLEEFTK